MIEGINFLSRWVSFFFSLHVISLCNFLQNSHYHVAQTMARQIKMKSGCLCWEYIFKRPGVAGAVLQSPPLLIDSLINSLINPLVQISSKHFQFQTQKTRKLKFLDNVHPTLCVMCHVSRVTCHVALVTCQKKYILFF